VLPALVHGKLEHGDRLGGLAEPLLGDPQGVAQPGSNERLAGVIGFEARRDRFEPAAKLALEVQLCLSGVEALKHRFQQACDGLGLASLGGLRLAGVFLRLGRGRGL
jgi:hypothetical protein